MSKRRATATQTRGRSTRTGRHDARAVVPAAPDRAESLASIADATVEASCLVAVISIPLYLSPLTSTLVETDKAVLLIVLAAIAGGAWCTGAVLRGHLIPRVQRSRALMWLGLAAFVTYALATILSIEPGVSFFGTLRRHEGLLTHAAALVFFVCVATRFRRVHQVERLI